MRGLSSVFLRGGLFGASLLGMPNIFGLMDRGESLPTPRSSFRKRGRRSRSRKYYGDRPRNNTGWWRRRADIAPMPITERMLLRHGWYRRQLRKQGIPMAEKFVNAVVWQKPVKL